MYMDYIFMITTGSQDIYTNLQSKSLFLIEGTHLNLLARWNIFRLEPYFYQSIYHVYDKVVHIWCLYMIYAHLHFKNNAL